METSAPEPRDISHRTDAIVVPEQLLLLKELRHKADRGSLYQCIVLGGSFVEGLGLLWFKDAVAKKRLEFHWKDNFPPIEMRHVLALLNGIGLIDDSEYKEFKTAAENRNYVVHHMYSQWVKSQSDLESMADSILKCVETIYARRKKLSEVLEKQVVSQETMRQGIRMILTDVSKYIADTRSLLTEGSIEHATMLAIYAAEELGKASLLFQSLLEDRPRVDLRLFSGRDAHEMKMTEARRILGDSVLLQSSIVGRAKLPFILGAPEVEAGPGLRMDCTFVDFREGDWKFGASFAKEHLGTLLTDLATQTTAILVRLDANRKGSGL